MHYIEFNASGRLYFFVFVILDHQLVIIYMTKMSILLKVPEQTFGAFLASHFHGKCFFFLSTFDLKLFLPNIPPFFPEIVCSI